MIEAIKNLEGHRVSVALKDGSRLDDCSLVSAGRGAVETVWIFTNGMDVFLPRDEVMDVWEVLDRNPRALCTAA